MFCNYCGKENKNDSSFCSYCGKKINQNSIQDTSVSPVEEKVISFRLSKPTLIIAACIVGAILLTAIVSIIIGMQLKKKPASSNFASTSSVISSKNDASDNRQNADNEGDSGINTDVQQSQQGGAFVPSRGAAGTVQMKNKPVYIGYKYLNKTTATAKNTPTTVPLSLSYHPAGTITLDNDITELPYNRPIPISLEYLNPERDLIIDVLINDSIAGTNCVYTTSSSKYKITSIDTAWDEEKSTYITNVTLQIPAVESVENRIITIKETSFLRDKIEGKADFGQNAQRVFSLQVDKFGKEVQMTENEDGTWTITKYTGAGGELVIPSTYAGKKITKIDQYAFKQSNITKVTVPNSVTYIGAGAFQECNKLVDFDFPWSKKLVLEFSMFSGCTSLENVTLGAVNEISSGENYLPSHMFENCTSLKNVTFTAGITYGISQECFSGCTSLKSIRIPGGCTINPETFKNAGLTTLYIEDDCTIHGEAFKNSKISAVYIKGDCVLTTAALSNAGSVDLYIGGRIKANESSFDRRSNGVKIHLKNSNADDEALLKKNNISYTVGW